MSDVRSPSLAMLLNSLKEGVFTDLHVSLPARVERYDAALQVVDAKPLIKDAYEGADGELIYAEFPVITNVPVMFPGGGGMRITFPIASGDTVLLVFGDRSSDLWQQGSPGVTTPVDEHRHHLTDAYAIPGLHSNTAPWAGAEEGVITLGSNLGAPDFAALSSKVDSTLNALKTVLNTWVPVPGDGGGSLKTALTALIATGWPLATGSTTVKIKG